MTAVENLDVSVVIPAYNEEALIARSLERVRDYLISIEDRYSWEVIVIDDGSSDATGAIVDDFASRHTNVRVLHHAFNTNLGQSLRDGFAMANGTYVVTLDSDLSYGPEHIGRLVDAIIEHHADVVVASPYTEGGRVSEVPRMREFLSRSSNRLLTFTAQGDLSTVTGMVRAYDREFLRTLNLKSWDFEINTEIIYKGQLLRARIIEIPAHLDWTDQNAAAETRTSSIRIARSVGSQAFTSFLFKPFFYFILPGMFVLTLALYSLGWSTFHTMSFWIRGVAPSFSDSIAAAFQLSPHSFVVGGIALIAAIQLLSLGILAAQNKRYFEELFHLGTAVLKAEQGLVRDLVGERGPAMVPAGDARGADRRDR